LPPLRIRPLELMHFAVHGKEAEPRGLLGEKSFATRFGDQLQMAVVLSEPAYFYIIAFSANGKENLLWPANQVLRSGGVPAAVTSVCEVAAASQSDLESAAGG
jgi:hypothetical protein